MYIQIASLLFDYSQVVCFCRACFKRYQVAKRSARPLYDCCVFDCSGAVSCRIWCFKMEIFLHYWRSCMENSLPGGLRLWPSRGFVLYGTFQILVYFPFTLFISFTWFFFYPTSTFHSHLSISLSFRTVLEEDEVYSVAQLLGDLVAYRASGTGHLELLAGFSQLLVKLNS